MYTKQTKKKKETQQYNFSNVQKDRVMGQLRQHRFKGMSDTIALHVFCNQAVKTVFKKTDHKPDGGQIVKISKRAKIRNRYN